jgi:excisionase family DNA binding protein
MPIDDPTLPRLLEVNHVAHRLSVSPDHVRRLIKAKKLPHVRLGTRVRVDAQDLHAFIEAQRVNGQGHGNGDGA